MKKSDDQYSIHAMIHDPAGGFYEGIIETAEGRFRRITRLGESLPYDRVKAGADMDPALPVAIPGLIDIHLHGAAGADLCDGTPEALDTIAAYELANGITAFAGALMTLPVPELVRIIGNAADYAAKAKDAPASPADPPRADLIGLNMEGPFISPKRKGAQDERYMIPADIGTAERFMEAGRGLVKFLAVAPEESPDAEAFIRSMKERYGGQVRISLAHTDADYACACRAMEAGADHVVHLFNAMPPFASREPSVIGAAADHADTDIEIICDGVHVHPAAVRGAFRMLGADRMILISDSMRAAGLADGEYTLGGLPVTVRGREARLTGNGALAGSVSNLMDCVRCAVREMGLPLDQAVNCASLHAARAVGLGAERGSIAEGKTADLVLLDRDLSVIAVMKDGRSIPAADT